MLSLKRDSYEKEDQDGIPLKCRFLAYRTATLPIKKELYTKKDVIATK
jgi:hypothetical protein